MLSRFSYGARRNILMILTGIMLSYIRNYLQYKRYLWDSISHFLGSSFVHYMAMLLVGGISYAVSKAKKNKFFEQDETTNEHEVGMNEFIYYYCIVVLVSCIFVFFVAHYSPRDLNND